MKSKKISKTATVPQKSLWKRMKRSWQAYLMILPIFIWFAVFEYWPLSWLRIVFYDYSLFGGIEGSEFVGLENFAKLFAKRNFLQMIWNAVAMNLWSLAIAFPAPIIFALFLNEMRFTKVKKVVQTVSFMPHFLSTVALVSIVVEVLSPRLGLIGKIVKFFGGVPVDYLSDPGWFRPIMVLSHVWANMGWSAIIYLAALTAIDPTLYEAAVVDGANRWQRIRNITIPGIKSTVILQLIMTIGQLLKTGYEKIYLLQNSLNLEVSEVLSTYMYKVGIQKMDYGMGSAADMFNAAISLVLVTIANRVSKKYSETSLW